MGDCESFGYLGNLVVGFVVLGSNSDFVAGLDSILDSVAVVIGFVGFGRAPPGVFLAHCGHVLGVLDVDMSADMEVVAAVVDMLAGMDSVRDMSFAVVPKSVSALPVAHSG